MKKQVALAVAAALSLSVAGTALAAPANPFVDVPANHWAYDALASLQKDGVVTGYGDGTFRGDRTLTRYEMAAMIAKITMVDDKNGPMIKRLQSEFATELYNLGVRVDKLEKGASTIKFTGDARIRYQRFPDNGTVARSRFQERVRINMAANVNDNINFYGRLVAVNDVNARPAGAADNESFTRPMYFDRAEFAWKNGNWGVSAGRMLPKIGQGIFAWNDRVDGVIGSYNNGKFGALAAVIDNTGTGNGNFSSTQAHVNATLAQMSYQFTNDFGMTAMYANAHNDDNILKPWSVGANWTFANDWNLTGEYMHNSGDIGGLDLDKKAYFARLTYGAAKMNKPGSFEAYAEYLKFGEASGATFINASKFDAASIPGFTVPGSSLTIADAKGWGVGLTYVVGKNHNMQLFYHDLKSNLTGEKYRKQYTIATNFNF